MTRDDKAWQKLEADIGVEVQSDGTPFPTDATCENCGNACEYHSEMCLCVDCENDSATCARCGGCYDVNGCVSACHTWND